MQLNSKHVDRAPKLPHFLQLHFVNKVVTFFAFSPFCIPLMGHCHELRNQVLKKGTFHLNFHHVKMHSYALI